MEQEQNEGSNQVKGKDGEDTAVAFLVSKGMTILERNWRVRHKEVDIIALDGEFIVFVEVKTRNTAPQRVGDLISRDKMQNLISAANYYVKVNHVIQECRFDVIALVGHNGHYDIDYVPNAFRAYLR